MAVGDGSTDQALTESWNGTGWSIVPTPTQASFPSLESVSCVSANSCEAVGSYSNGSSISQTLVESWDGTSWTIVSSSNRGTSDNVFQSVSCVSASSCKAVGHELNNNAHTLVESWNGTSWAIVTSPNHANVDNALYGVSCFSTTSCVADGNYNGRTLVESWNGTRWSIVASPNIGIHPNLLNGVSCTSATSCVAAGQYYNPKLKSYQTLIESSTGAHWSVKTSPNQSGYANELQGVSCLSTTSCVAVGFYGVPKIPGQTLIEQWNGTSWSIVPSPNM
jgi:hypothetical protein